MYIEIGENLFVYTKLCGIQQPEIYGRTYSRLSYTSTCVCPINDCTGAYVVVLPGTRYPPTN